MKQSIAILVVTAACAATLAGCAKSPTRVEQADMRVGFMSCAEPRPEACTMQYDPVCGETMDGRSKTYSNACSACSDRLVIGYAEGACASADKPTATP